MNHSKCHQLNDLHLFKLQPRQVLKIDVKGKFTSTKEECFTYFDWNNCCSYHIC